MCESPRPADSLLFLYLACKKKVVCEWTQAQTTSECYAGIDSFLEGDSTVACSYNPDNPGYSKCLFTGYTVSDLPTMELEMVDVWATNGASKFLSPIPTIRRSS